MVCQAGYGQSVLDTRLDGSEQGKALTEYLQEFEQSHPVRFYFLNNWLDSLSLRGELKGTPLRDALYDLLLGTDVNFIEVNPHAIVFVKDPAQQLLRNQLLSAAATRSQAKIEKILIGRRENNRKQRVTLSGTVTDAKTRSPLVGVNVLATDLKVGSATDSQGRFEFKLPAGEHVLTFNYVSFEEKVLDLEIFATGSIRIELEEVPTVLDEVLIQDSRRDITTTGLGQTQISMKEVKRAPAMLGEVDLVKQIQILPGVTSVGEAASGYNVRGGSVDQNLILYDGMPIFNSSHVFGFFSSFNAEAIRDVTFYRGGIPADYGGRISSVLDIRSKEGSYEKWTGGAGIGIIASNFMIQGPIRKDKTSVALSLRTTYSDFLMNSIRSNYLKLNNSSVSFYDATAKVTHQFSERTKLTLSGYISHDKFKVAGDSSYSWDSKLASLRLDHEFNKRLTGSLSAGWGSYSYEVSDDNELSGFTLNYRINYPSARVELHLAQGKQKLSFGGQTMYYDFNPGTLSPNGAASNRKFVRMDPQRSLESALFITDQFDVFPRMHVDAGLRLSAFHALGPSNINIYAPGVPRETINLIDTVKYGSGQSVTSFLNPEPRLAIRYELSGESSIKIGYNRIFQYLHLVTNTTAVTPVDIWQPSGPYFKPQMADQVSIGYFRNFKQRAYEAFAEVYYKKIDNVLDFKDGYSLILNPQVETALLQGKARAYGAEFQVAKNQGRLVGSLSYAYSRSLRTFQGLYPVETINNGKEYASNYDQPHVVNLQWRYNISRRFFFTGIFTYRTGRPITLPLSAFTINYVTVSSFSDRNQYRIPDYHRLDLALVIEGNHKRRRILDGTWTFSIYNVYGRKNPYSVFFKEVRPGILRPYRLAIIGSALPSITYSFKI